MTFHRHIAGRSVSLNCASDLQPQADAVLDALEARADSGPTLADGTTVQFGWTRLTLRADDQALVVCEPNFDGDALKEERDSVDVSLRVLTEQVAVLRQVNAPAYPIEFSDWVVVDGNSLSVARIYLQRKPPATASDSGWYIGAVENPYVAGDEAALGGARVYQFHKLRPTVLSVLALPPEYMVVINGVQIEAIFDPGDVNRWRAS